MSPSTIKALFIFLFWCSSLPAQTFWQQCNGPYGSSYNSAFALDSTGKFYVATDDLYSTSNNGQSWEKVDLPFGAVNSIAFHPNGSIFLATHNNSYDYTVYRSTNGGLNWDFVLNPAYYANVVSFLIDHSGKIHVGTRGGGIYSSSNNGNNWSHIFVEEDVRSMGINSKGYLFAGMLSGGLFRSTDNGINWTEMAFLDTSVYSITVNSANILFVCAEGTIFKSTDDGISWIYSSNGIPPDQDVKVFVDQKDNLYCGCRSGIYRSTNNGINWVNVNNGIPPQGIISFFQLPNGYLFAGSWGKAVNRSTNDGLNWELSNAGINNSQIQSLLCYSSNIVIAGVYSSGIFYSSNQGTTWNASNLQISLENTYYNSLGKDNFGKLFAGVEGKLYTSLDSGKTWNFLAQNIGVDNITVAPNNYLYTSSEGMGVYRSSNGGVNWINLNGTESQISALGCNSEGVLYCGSIYGRVYRSTNYGNNWKFLQNTYPGDQITGFAFNSDSNIWISTYHGVFLSTDAGHSWISHGLNGFIVNKIILLPDKILAVCDNQQGAYYTKINESSWYSIGTGLEYTITSDMIIDSSGYLYCGTYNKGLFKSTTNLISVNKISSKIPVAFLLYQNYPNPFNPSTKIKFDIPKESFVELRIYDILGRKVADLNNRVLKPGSYEIEWNAGNNASGVYFYSLKAGGFNMYKKMVLIK